MKTGRHRRAHSLDNPSLRCQSKMANLFDSSAGLTSNNDLLPDNPNPNGLSLPRSLSNMPMSPCSLSKNQVEDKKTPSQMRRTSSGQKSLWAPMKALIAEEMSKDIETRQLRPNVVAKLMGLEAFPQKKPHLCDQKRLLRTCPDISHVPVERAAEFWEDKEVQKKLPKLHQSKDCTGFHEMLQQSNNPNAVREQLPQKGRWDRGKHEKKMALVRQKFVEAKRLITDEKLRHTKEFQDALEVLSSNRELFLSFLQEPNYLFSGNLRELQSLSHKTKHITILRPSKMVDHENFSMTGNQIDKIMKQPSLVAEPNDAEHVYDCADRDNKACPPQPTRIVVLKPSSGKIGETKTSTSPCYEDANCDEKLESSDVTGEIPRKVQENLVSGRRDGTLLSSVYSNDYTGDDRSFYKSEGEAIGNLSNYSELMSPHSRHSWDFINKVGSPYSCSSFSHAAYSPESLVWREAKKRLSERWTLMASHETFSEQRHVRKDSSTLGEMLAVIETKKKKSVRAEESASGKEQQLIGSTWLISDSNKEETLVDSPKCLMRSKSLPVSSLIYSDNLNVEAVDPRMGKSDTKKSAAKKGNAKPSPFKAKVSSLFFFMSRKSKKETSGKPQHEGEIQSAVVDSPRELMEAKNCDDTSEIGNDNCLGPCSSPSQNRSLPEDADVHTNGGTVANKVGLTGSKSAVPDSKDNQDHQSPISVLDPSFYEDDSLTSESSGNQGPVFPLRFNLIEKSPPIGSITRTLSLDDGINKSATPYFSKSPTASPVMEEEALDWLTFVQTLLSKAGFDGQLSLDAVISRWHSSESPLFPSLREKFTNVNDKGAIIPEAKRRQRMSERKLAYDCLNKALLKVGGLLHGPYAEARGGNGPATLSRVGDRVWTQMTEWLSDEVGCVSKGDGESNSLVVEKVVRREVVGKVWVHHLATEMDCLGKNIELKLLDELVDEAVTYLTGRL